MSTSRMVVLENLLRPPQVAQDFLHGPFSGDTAFIEQFLVQPRRQPLNVVGLIGQAESEPAMTVLLGCTTGHTRIIES